MREWFIVRAAGVDDEAAQGDVQLHQEPAPGGGRPLGAAVGAHVDHGQRQPPGGDNPEPAPVTGRQQGLLLPASCSGPRRS